MDRGMQAASGRSRGKETDPILEPPEGHLADL